MHSSQSFLKWWRQKRGAVRFGCLLPLLAWENILSGAKRTERPMVEPKLRICVEFCAMLATLGYFRLFSHLQTFSVIFGYFWVFSAIFGHFRPFLVLQMAVPEHKICVKFFAMVATLGYFRLFSHLRTFSVIFGYNRKFSDIFGHFRTFSDVFGLFSFSQWLWRVRSSYFTYRSSF